RAYCILHVTVAVLVKVRYVPAEMPAVLEAPPKKKGPKAWEPPLSAKQLQLMRICQPTGSTQKYVLVSGPRRSGKSWTCLDIICNHAWNTDRGAISFLSPSISTGADMGLWAKLVGETIPKWIKGDFGFDWYTDDGGKEGERIHGATKRIKHNLRNKYGICTTIQLDSLKHEHEVEERYKSKEYSMIYMPELSNY